MQIYSVNSAQFRAYGKVLQGYDVSELIKVLNGFELPERGCMYVASEPALEQSKAFEKIKNNAYGGLDIQMGMSRGFNTKLSCLEYHRCSEILINTEDVVLPLGLLTEVEDHIFDTSKIKAFLVPAGTVVELYATTLHYAACNPYKGFRIAVVQAKGTNGRKPDIITADGEDKLLWAKNNWLLAHKDSNEAKMGAHIGITGEIIEIKEF